jgi:hypothetical protein
LAPLLLLLLAGGCARQAVTLYGGTYTRTWVNAEGEALQKTGPVTLEISERGSYRIVGESADLPPARTGRFIRHGDEFIFVDTTPPTAGYSLNLILNGTFRVAEDERNLILSQENTWGHSHLLILERQP